MTQRPMTPLAAPLAALSLLAPGLAAAQVLELPEIVVSANLEPTAANRSGATVEVITEQDLQATGEIRIVDFLNRLPGVNVRTTGGPGQPATVSVRGASQNYVAVLVDGIDVTDPSGTQVAFDFGQMTTAGISRIEVLKGSQSALYGSNAVGGVINITTRRATDPGLNQYLDVEGGSYATGQAAYSLTYLTDSVSAAFTLSRVQTDGFSSADENDGNTENDPYDANRLSFNLATITDGGAEIGVSGFAEGSSGEYDEGFPLADGTPGDELLDRNSQGVRVYGTFVTGVIENTLSASYFNIDRQYRQDSGFFASDNTYTGERRALSYQGALDLGPDARGVFGLDWKQEDYDQTGTFGDLDAETTTTGIFGEVTWSPGDAVDLTATLRHDDESSFGGKTTGRLSLAYSVQPDLILRAQAGTGYRAPSGFELYSAYGNTGLQPEDSRSADVGVEKIWGDTAFLRATAFWLEVDNLIDYDFDSTSCQSYAETGFAGCYAQIPGISQRTGLEVEGEVAVTDAVTLGLAYTYMDSDTNASSAWANLPKNDVVLTAAAQMTDQVQGIMTVHSAMDRPDLPDYTVVNATVTYDFANDTQAYVRVENLFDEQYQLVDGYGTSDRALFVGLRAAF
jgi:vitamin B12 transporter